MRAVGCRVHNTPWDITEHRGSRGDVGPSDAVERSPPIGAWANCHLTRRMGGGSDL